MNFGQIVVVLVVVCMAALFILLKRPYRWWHTEGEGAAAHKVTDRDIELRNGWSVVGGFLLLGLCYYVFDVYAGVPEELTEGRTYMMERNAGTTWVRRFEVGNAKGQVSFDDVFLKHLDAQAQQVISSKNAKASEIKFVPESVEYAITRESTPKWWMKFYKLGTDVRGTVTWKETEGNPPAKVEKKLEGFLVAHVLYLQSSDLAKQMGTRGLVKDSESAVKVNGIQQLPTSTGTGGTVNSQ